MEEPEAISLDLCPPVATAAQNAFLMDPSECPAFSGGYGSGKTHIGIYKSLQLAYQFPEEIGLVIEPTYRHVHDILIPKFEDILASLEIPFTYNKGDNELVFRDGPLIKLRTAEHPERIVGFEAGWMWVDEAQLCSRVAWTKGNQRGRGKTERVRQKFSTFTPDTPCWTHELWGCKELLGDELPIGHTVHFGSTYQSINAGFIDRAYGATLESSCDSDMAIAVLGGHFCVSKRGRVFYTFDQRGNVKHEAVYDNKLPLGLTWDFNPGLHDTCLVCQFDGARYLVVDEIAGKGQHYEQICETILDRYAGRQWGPVTVYGDSYGHHVSSKLSYYDSIMAILKTGINGRPAFRPTVTLDVPRADPSVVNTCEQVRAMLCNARGVRTLLINPTCKGLIADLEGVRYASAAAEERGVKYTGDQDAIDKTDPNRVHFGDALRYWCAKVGPARSHYVRPTDNFKMGQVSS